MTAIPLFKVYMNKNAPEMVGNVLMSGMITQAKKVEEFEESLKQFFYWPYVITINSTTSGLTLAYRLLGITKQDKVISTPLTCFATTCAILANTENIVWADTDPETCNIDLEDVKKKITSETKALSFVHWAGVPVDLDKVKELKQYAKETFGIDLGVVEDCAHAFGTEWNNRKLGTHGNIAVYSLQANKHLTTGDGGILVLPNEEMYNRAKLLRWYGIDRENRSKPGTDFRLEPDIPEWGYKFNMNDINATIGLANLPDMTKLLSVSQNNANIYDRHFKDCNNIKTYTRDKRATPSFWIYTLRVLNGLKPLFLQFMKEKGIVVSQVHSRNDNHSCVKDLQTELPKLKIVENEIVSIPCGWWVSEKDREYIINTVKEFDKRYTLNSLTESSHDNSFIQPLGYGRDKIYIELLNHLNSYTNGTPVITDEMRQQIYVLNVAGKIVSSAKLVYEDKVYDPVGHIEDVVTLTEHRGKGYGKILVKYLCKLALTKCHKVILSAKPELQKFYQDCGLEATGIAFTSRR